MIKFFPGSITDYIMAEVDGLYKFRFPVKTIKDLRAQLCTVIVDLSLGNKKDFELDFDDLCLRLKNDDDWTRLEIYGENPHSGIDSVLGLYYEPNYTMSDYIEELKRIYFNVVDTLDSLKTQTFEVLEDGKPAVYVTNPKFKNNVFASFQDAKGYADEWLGRHGPYDLDHPGVFYFTERNYVEIRSS